MATQQRPRPRVRVINLQPGQSVLVRCREHRSWNPDNKIRPELRSRNAKSPCIPQGLFDLIQSIDEYATFDGHIRLAQQATPFYNCV